MSQRGAPKARPDGDMRVCLELARLAGQKRDEPHRNQIFPFNAGGRPGLKNGLAARHGNGGA
jgi:hypothetical protein